MYPSTGWTDPHPCQRNQMNTPGAHLIEAFPSNVKIDPATPTSPCQPWPYGGNYGYPIPLERRGCCNHHHVGGHYGFLPPHTCFPLLPPFHIWGGYPPYPSVYPAYAVPPPHYPVEQPRDYHCCGCPHHTSMRESDKNIEPETPEVNKNHSDSLVPSQLGNFTYPIMWIPPGYMKNAEAKEDKFLHDTKGDEKSKPLHAKYLEPSDQAGNNRTVQNLNFEDTSQLPFPIFLLPCNKNEKEEEDERKSNVRQESISKLSGSGDMKSRSRTSEKNSSSEPKLIPVKQMETPEEENISKCAQTKAKCSHPVENTDDNREGKPSGNTGKAWASSPKTSKLPPICLRVDPLPRKKNGNGISRSTSPPTDKGGSKEPPKDSEHQTQLSNGLKKSKVQEHSKDNIKTIEVINGVSGKDKNDGSGEKVGSDMKDKDCGEVDDGKNTMVDEQSSNGKSETGERRGICYSKEKESGGGCKAERKKLTEQEAAVIIQSAYRGFEVRKSQPLRKLKQIAEVEKQVAEVTSRIKDLESLHVQVEDKQKVIVGETIMSLLLKLDTIQGLHPMVRDVRKSVAKKLVRLQEKLDSLAYKKSETLNGEAFSSKPDANITEMQALPAGEFDENFNGQVVQMPICNNAEVDVRLHQIEDPINGKQIDVETVDNGGKEGNEERGVNVPEKVKLGPKGMLAKSIEAVDVEPMEEDHPMEEVKETEAVDVVPVEVVPDMEVKAGSGRKDEATKDEIVKLQDFHLVTEQKEDVVEDSKVPLVEDEISGRESLEVCDVRMIDGNEGNEETKEHEQPANVDDNENQEVTIDAPNEVLMEEKESTEHDEKETPPLCAAGSQVLLEGDGKLMEDKKMESSTFGLPKKRKLVEEHDSLKELMEKLIQAGNEQLTAISKLSGRVEDLEKKLSKRKKPRSKRCKSHTSSIQDEPRTCHI